VLLLLVLLLLLGREGTQAQTDNVNDKGNKIAHARASWYEARHCIEGRLMLWVCLDQFAWLGAGSVGEGSIDEGARRTSNKSVDGVRLRERGDGGSNFGASDSFPPFRGRRYGRCISNHTKRQDV